MSVQNLILNILTFNQPVEQKDFEFYTEKRNGSFPINKYEFPVNIEEIFPEVKAQQLEHLYTEFESSQDKKDVIIICFVYISFYSRFNFIKQPDQFGSVNLSDLCLMLSYWFYRN